MLLITGWKNDEFEEELSNMAWHLGEPVPNMARVVKFQADGDELNLFVQAMCLTRENHQGIGYTKRSGFRKNPLTESIEK